ncbi:MAG: hypothetical protein E7522_07225 [Ruminococcaceae bacterium]|nr:hypothetical protein [Oscillospiraceae bacterium]
MNIYEVYYTAIANRYNTDIDGAKEIIEKYLKDLKKEIDESDDEKVKTLWYEEFAGKEYPDAEEFLNSIYLFGENPFIPKK